MIKTFLKTCVLLFLLASTGSSDPSQSQIASFQESSSDIDLMIKTSEPFYPTPLFRSKQVFDSLRKSKSSPQKILLVGNETRFPGLGWGDVILDSRQLIARLLKTYANSLQEIKVISAYPDIIYGFDQLVNTQPLKKGEKFDLIIDMRIITENNFLESRSFVPQSYLIDEKNFSSGIVLYQKSLPHLEAELEKSRSYKINYSKPLSTNFLLRKNILDEFGLHPISPSEYLLRGDNSFLFLENREVFFVNFLAKTNEHIAHQTAQHWAQVIQAFLEQGRKVVINGGPGNNETDQKLLDQVFQYLPYEVDSLPESLEIKTFPDREEVIRFFNKEVHAVVTIDTGLFWAGVEIVGVPTVVITTDTVFFQKEQEKGFTSLEEDEFLHSPLTVMEHLFELESSHKKQPLSKTLKSA